MYQALIAACCALAGVHPPLAQNWSDSELIRVDDDWSAVTGIAGYRGDGLTGVPGTDPRAVVADGSGTPVDVSANRTDPGAIGLAAGVAEFELANPVVALRGSATASAPQLVIALDTRDRAGIAVRLTLRDIDGSADAVQAVAIQYRVGGAGDFANVPGGYVADATQSTIGPDSVNATQTSVGTESANATQTSVGIEPANGSSYELDTPVHVALPPAADDAQRVEVRVLTTNADGRDEWVGVDDIEVTAATVMAPACPAPQRHPWREPDHWPQPGPAPRPEQPARSRPALTALSLSPRTFTAARRGPAVTRRGRAGAALRFRLSEPATVRFRVAPRGGGLRFQLRGRRGVNRMRFTGSIRGRRLPAGNYALSAIATDREGLESTAAIVPFRIAKPQD